MDIYIFFLKARSGGLELWNETICAGEGNSEDSRKERTKGRSRFVRQASNS